jgi:hypothetical protein
MHLNKSKNKTKGKERNGKERKGKEEYKTLKKM